MKKTLVIVSISGSFLLVVGAIAALVVVLSQNENARTSEKPNFIIFLADDTGYADFSCFGHPTQEKGAIDRMAEEGIMFTQWTSASSSCSPSRAAMLTGRYPIRTGIFGNKSRAITVGSSGGLPRQETTLAEALTDLGYANGFVGKWHLGK